MNGQMVLLGSDREFMNGQMVLLGSDREFICKNGTVRV